MTRTTSKSFGNAEALRNVSGCPLHRGLFLASSSPLSYFLMGFFFFQDLVCLGWAVNRDCGGSTNTTAEACPCPSKAGHGRFGQSQQSQPEEEHRTANPHRTQIPHWQVHLLAEEMFVTPQINTHGAFAVTRKYAQSDTNLSLLKCTFSAEAEQGHPPPSCSGSPYCKQVALPWSTECDIFHTFCALWW